MLIVNRRACLLYLLRVGPHPHALSLGGALCALPFGASLGPQAPDPCPCRIPESSTVPNPGAQAGLFFCRPTSDS